MTYIMFSGIEFMVEPVHKKEFALICDEFLCPRDSSNNYCELFFCRLSAIGGQSTCSKSVVHILASKK